jgi:hypothetical protein
MSRVSVSAAPQSHRSARIVALCPAVSRHAIRSSWSMRPVTWTSSMTSLEPAGPLLIGLLEEVAD